MRFLPHSAICPLVACFVCGCDLPPEFAAEAVSPMTDSVTAAAKGTLAPGNSVPPLQAQGWIGPPPAPDLLSSGSVAVIDVWGKWCPYSDSTAPELVNLHRVYKDHGVQFVSLTSDPRPIVKAFVAEHGLTWPAGFGASLDTIGAFGALNPLPPAPGYEVLPTFYVVGRNGRIHYCDQAARYRHQEAELICLALSEAIEEALRAGDSSRTSKNRVQKRADGRTSHENQDADG